MADDDNGDYEDIENENEEEEEEVEIEDENELFDLNDPNIVDFENPNNPMGVPDINPFEWVENHLYLLQRSKSRLNLENESTFGDKSINGLVDMGYMSVEEAKVEIRNPEFKEPYVLRQIFYQISIVHQQKRPGEILHITSIHPDYRGEDFFDQFLKNGYCTLLFWQKPNTTSLYRIGTRRYNFISRNPDGTISRILPTNLQGCVLIEKRRNKIVVLIRNNEGRMIETDINRFFQIHRESLHYVIGIGERDRINRGIQRDVLSLNRLFVEKQEPVYKPVRRSKKAVRYSPYNKKKTHEIPKNTNLPSYLPSDISSHIYSFLKNREYSPKRR